jgi:hypothetical protein
MNSGGKNLPIESHDSCLCARLKSQVSAVDGGVLSKSHFIKRYRPNRTVAAPLISVT